MPEGIAGNLTPEQLADLVAYLQSLDPMSPAPAGRARPRHRPMTRSLRT